jgi:hypothetical protein
MRLSVQGEGKTMKLSKKLIAVPALALAAGLSLAACGSGAPVTAVPMPKIVQTTPAPAPTTPAPTTPAPKPAPTHTVYVPAPTQAPAPVSPEAPYISDVTAGPNTSYAFAQNVAAAYNGNGGDDVETVYSPVTGESYTMYYTRGEAGDFITATGGNDASVTFKLN